MKETESIENHLEQLQQLCMVCQKRKCKDHTKVCALKKLAWNYAKRRYENKKGRVQNNGSI